MTEDPKRLLLTEEGRLAAGLAVARRQGPSDAELTALAERLVRAGIALPEDIVRGSPTPAASPNAARAPSARDSSPLAKVMLVGLPLVAVAILFAWLNRPNAPAEPRAELPLAPVQGALPGLPAQPSNPTPRTATEPPAGAVERPSAAAFPGQKPSEEAAAATPEESTSAGPEAPSVAAKQRPPTEASAPPRPQSNSSSPSPARAAAGATNPGRLEAPSDNAGSSSPPASTPESEIELLKRARNTLPADPARALALTERCAEEYPRGAFTQERDFIAISALSRVGRRYEAVSRAERFRSSYPKSVYLPQLERMLLLP